MIKATTEFLNSIDTLSNNKKAEILSAKDEMSICGTIYYVSNSGNDSNDGRSPDSPWKSLNRVSSASLNAGDGVLFKRGDTFRGCIITKPGVTYAAYGKGDKPKFYGWDKNLSNKDLWEIYDAKNNIWKLKESILDCGTLVFNGGERHSRKLIPSYINSQFVCRNDESKLFDMASEMIYDLDMVCFYDKRITREPSKGEAFPIPLMDSESYGELYLKCDKGNPAEVFGNIEAVPRRSMFYVQDDANVTIDNLCIKYVGIHGVAAGGHVVGLHVSNCEIGWIGGTIQHYLGTDPNYPKGGRGTVTRYGNGVEVYGGCDDYVVDNCYIYQVYDAGITHQVTTFGKKYEMKNIRYSNNLVEYCVYSIEYFLEKNCGDTESYIKGCEIYGNILRFSGYGWGQQRHNVHTPAHIKGWSYENTASDFSIHHNVFDRAAYRMLHLVAKKAESCPKMYENTYIQTIGNPLGQYGANETEEPEILPFDKNADMSVNDVFDDKNAKIYYVNE